MHPCKHSLPGDVWGNGAYVQALFRECPSTRPGTVWEMRSTCKRCWGTRGRCVTTCAQAMFGERWLRASNVWNDVLSAVNAYVMMRTGGSAVWN
eukprot:690174-Pyramimonas_sp.AAC.1